MELTLFVQKGKKEVINRVELSDVAASIQHEIARVHVRRLREKYHLMNPKRQPDGRITTNFADGIGLPRICFSALFKHNKGELKMLKYNGLVVVEVNDLPNYDTAVTVREQAKRMPETMMCFLGASGKSVKIVVRGELYGSGGSDNSSTTSIIQPDPPIRISLASASPISNPVLTGQSI